MAKLQRISLSTAEDVRRYMAKIIKRVENDEIELNKARLLLQLAEGILKSIRTDELERKIMDIENKLENGFKPEQNNESFEEFLQRKAGK